MTFEVQRTVRGPNRNAFLHSLTVPSILISYTQPLDSHDATSAIHEMDAQSIRKAGKDLTQAAGEGQIEVSSSDALSKEFHHVIQSHSCSISLP